jgi:haloalkane dehalogenase
LARELRDSSAWYDELWRQRTRIKEIPALLLWGLKDPIFKARHLARWQALFTNAQTVRFPEAGHYVQEEERDILGQLVGQFLVLTKSGA